MGGITGRLERAGRGDNVLGLDLSFRRVDQKGASIRGSGRVRDFHAGADGGVHLACVFDQIVCNTLFAGEFVGSAAIELKVGKAIVPGRAIGHQRIPAARAPCFGNTVFFKDEVFDAVIAEMFAHGDSGLAASDHKGVYFFNRHVLHPFSQVHSGRAGFETEKHLGTWHMDQAAGWRAEAACLSNSEPEDAFRRPLRVFPKTSHTILFC